MFAKRFRSYCCLPLAVLATVCLPAGQWLLAEELDITPPTIFGPGDIGAEGGPSGATVYFDVYAVDDSGEVLLTVEPPSGSLFAPGETLVTCTAEDPTGNTATYIFSVTVVDDITSPSIITPPDVTVNAWEDTSPARTGVAMASDNSGLPPEISFSDVSQAFADFIRIVRTWTATDESGNSTSARQVIQVITDPRQLTTALEEEVAALDLPANVERPLDAILNTVRASLHRGNQTAAAGKLAAFIRHVNAQRGRHLTDEEADFLIDAATTILDSLGD